MVDETKKDQQPDTTADQGENQDEGGESVEKKDETIDYKAELAKVQKQLGQAEHTILKLKADKKKEPESVDEEEEDETTETPQEIARKEARKYFVNLSKTQADNYAGSISENEDEKKLIMFHYENTIVPTGNIEADIRRAKLLANEKRIDKDMEQLKKAAASKASRSNDSGEGGQKPATESGEPQLSEKDKQVLASAGLTWDSKRKGYVGASGRFHSWAEIQKTIMKK